MKGSDPLTAVFGSVLALGWVIGLIVMIGFGGFLPLMVFSIMRSMKAIRRELETLNETLQQRLSIR
jgi:hypothetical protein